MVRPHRFRANPETAASNLFQQPPGHSPDAVASAACREFDALAGALDRSGVQVLLVEGSEDSPDAVFPNNWFSTHGDGTVIFYPLASALRRLERRPALLRDQFCRARLSPGAILDLSYLERHGRALEGTGSLVLDRIHGVAYGARSPRTSPEALDEFTARTGYEVVSFDTALAGVPVYHTNVAMALGTTFAVLCTSVISEPAHRRRIEDSLAATGRRLVVISPEQMMAFAANLLELESSDGTPVIALSSGAWAALDPPQRRVLEAAGQPLPVPVPTIEAVGGGGVRCMLAEIFLPAAPN